MKFLLTRMHSSRMCTAHSLIVSPYLVVSHACPRSNHACPPGATTHAPPGATTHTPPDQPHMPPEQPHMPPWEQPLMPPGSNHTHPLPSEHPCMPPPLAATTHAPPVTRITGACENITLPPLRCGR